MARIASFFAKPFRYTVCFALVLILFTVYVFLDVFYLEKLYAVMEESPVDFYDLYSIETTKPNENPVSNSEENPSAAEQGEEMPYIEPGIRLATYVDDNIELTIEQFEGEGGSFFVAEVKLSSVNYLRTALHKGQLGKNITAPTSEIAEDNNALFAISGDYAGYNERGVIARNGQILRVAPREGQYGLVVDIYGDFLMIPEIELTEEKLREVNALHCFSLGPTLVVDGEINISVSNVSVKRNPRTAIGQKGPLHYIFIVTNGRSNEIRSGMLFPELAEELLKRGCTMAYNLDGGGTSTIWYDGEVINTPSTNGVDLKERNISDIVYIPRG
ncbi:MAG: phosphodiester glycosidase family protein [Oscillospiraceae bacterium]|jgi:exopolysaccharide biosynthesis protein|nr:phosphodiester glycosidase family protein [Oscillospiraceae bacterium]